MTHATPTRRFRFSLRTLFVVVTLLCLWLGYQVNWIRQRREFLEMHSSRATSRFRFVAQPVSLPKVEHGRAPWSIRWLGEDGALVVVLPEDATEETRQKAISLFPEAAIERWEWLPLAEPSQ